MPNDSATKEPMRWLTLLVLSVCALPVPCFHEQAGEPELVRELGNEALLSKLERAGKRDVLLAMALAECDLAQDAVTKDEIALACARLNNARDLLQQGGMPPISDILQGEIETCLESLVAPCILEHLSVPLEAPHSKLRMEALQVLKSFFDYGPAEVLGGDPNQVETSTSIYMSSIQKRLTAQEMVDLVPWMDVVQAYQKARSLDVSAKFSPSNVVRKSLNPQMPDELEWFSPTTFHNAAVAHIVVGFLKQNPILIAKAEKILDMACLSHDAVRVEKAVCKLLLADANGALEVLFFPSRKSRAATLPSSFKPDAFKRNGSGQSNASTSLSTSLKSRDEVLEFIKQNSPQNGEGEEGLLPGLCLFVEKWLKLVGYQRFRDTAEGVMVPAQLSPYFESRRVQRFIVRRESRPDLLDENFAPLQAVASVLVASGSLVSRLVEEGRRRLGPAVLSVVRKAHEGSAFNKRGEMKEASGNSAALVSLLALPLVVRQGIALAVLVSIISAVGAVMKPHFKVKPVVKGAVEVEKSPPAKTSIPVIKVEEAPKSSSILTVYSAGKLINDWQVAKALGMGPWHDVSGIKLMLLDPMLTDWLRRVKHAEGLGCSWKYNLEKLTVIKVDQEPGSPVATVTASLEETGELHDSKDNVLEKYKDKYVVMYTAVRSKGTWNLSACKIVK